jgi:cell wall-associated NlpC family hydrolase
MPLNGRALFVTGTGVLFVWSGIRGWSVLGTIGDAITGNRPNQPVSYPLSIAPKGGDAAGTVPSSGAGGIAGIALQYQGHAYRFGGAPGKDGSKPWDCSSFVNFVVAIKAGMAIPGNKPGQYNGSSHGPTTGVWAVWTGMATVSRSDVQAGDILVWGSHMGIATDNSHYISAHSPAKGTTVTGIPTSGLGPLVRIGRLR